MPWPECRHRAGGKDQRFGAQTKAPPGWVAGRRKPNARSRTPTDRRTLTVAMPSSDTRRQTSASAAGSSTSATILPIGYTFKIIVGPRMVVRRVGAHATDYVCADSRRLVAGSSALQLVDDLLWGKGLVARSSLDCWKDGEDLISSGHMGESVPVGLPRVARSSANRAIPR